MKENKILKFSSQKADCEPNLDISCITNMDEIMVRLLDDALKDPETGEDTKNDALRLCNIYLGKPCEENSPIHFLVTGFLMGVVRGMIFEDFIVDAADEQAKQTDN